MRRGEIRARPDAPRDHRHRARVGEEQPPGAALDHLVGHLHHHRDRAKPAHDPADADGVADGLSEPVLLRHLEVRDGRGIPTDLDLVDQVVGTVERRSPIAVRGHPVARAELFHQGARSAFGVPEPFGIDVVQRDLEGSVQLCIRAEVGDDAPGELDAARADDRHLRHGPNASTERFVRHRRRDRPARRPAIVCP